MAELNTADIEHVDIIDKEFRESLRKYNIKFEGRGKHIKKAQDDIISNLNLINEKSQELKDLIDEVQFNLDEFYSSQFHASQKNPIQFNPLQFK